MTAQATSAAVKCKFCRCKLGVSPDDDFERQECTSCQQQLLRPPVLEFPKKRTPDKVAPGGRRDFTPSERSLIRKVHGYMAANQLLDILNARLVSDVGDGATPYTLEQLHAEIGDNVMTTQDRASDWARLRRLLAEAAKKGTLSLIDCQLVNDFATVFSCNASQLAKVKDIIAQAKEDYR